ncbi:hypothetical protein UlMin_004687 [Ulmus minor]
MFFSTLLVAKLYHSSPSSSSSIQPLQTLLKRGFTPTLKSINQFLSFLCQERKFKFIIHFVSQLNSNQIIENSETRSILTWALLESNKFEEAEQFLKTQMAKSSNFPKSRIWDSLIRGLCIDRKDPEKAFSVLRDCLKNNGGLPSSFTFCSLIHGFSSQGDMGKAIEVLELMTEVKYPFDNFVCSSVIAGFCRIGKPEFAIRFFENAINSGALQPNVVTYTALLVAFCKLGKVKEVRNLVKRMEKEGVALDIVFYSSWICGSISEGLLMEVFRKTREVVEKGISPDTISYTILIDGFSKLADVEKANGFLEKMRSGGLEPNLITFTAIILGFCKKGKMEEAFAVFKMVEDLGIEGDEFMYAILIEGSCRMGNFDLVFNLLDEMEKRGINPSIVTYNTLINGLCKFGRTSEADKFSQDIVGDTITYSTLLHGYVEEENVTGILETKRRFEESRVPVDVVMCNILIKALFTVGAFDDAYVLYKGMEEMDLIANSVTYSTMIHGYCKVGRIHEAVEIFNECRSKSIYSVACYNCLISGLCSKGMVDMAEEVFVELSEKGLALDVGIYMMLTKTILEEKGAAGVPNLLHRLENTRPEVYAMLCNNAIRFLCKRRYPEDALEVLLGMKGKGSILTSKSYYLIIKGLITSANKWVSSILLNNFLKEYGLFEPRVIKLLAYYLCLKDVNSALWFLDKMKDNSLIVSFPRTVFKALLKDRRVLDVYKLVVEAEDNLPDMDVFTYTHVVHGLCRRGYIDEALDIFGFARRKGITPNIVSYNSIIGGLCRQGRLVEAFRLFDSLERNDLVPSEITYAILIAALCREGFLLDAKQLFERMLLAGFKPNIRVYNSVIDGYCKSGQMEEALKFLYDSEVKCVEHDGFTISALINGCCLKGDMEGALEYFFRFKSKGILPDFLGFMYLVRGLCAKGRMEEARSILREMLLSQSVIEVINKVDVELETESVEGFLTCLCEQGNIKEAVTVLNEVGSIFFPARTCSSYLNVSRPPKKLYDMEASESVIAESVASLERIDLPFGSFGMEGTKIVKCHDHLGCSSQFHDFDYYYSLIASLCSRGDVQKACQVAKEVLPRLD